MLTYDSVEKFAMIKGPNFVDTSIGVGKGIDEGEGGGGVLFTQLLA